VLEAAAALIWRPVQTRHAATPPLGLGVIHPPPDGSTRRPDQRLCFIIILQPLQPTVATHHSLFRLDQSHKDVSAKDPDQDLVVSVKDKKFYVRITV